MLIETEHLDLRQWRDSDRPEFHRINSDPEVRKYFPDIPTRMQSDELIDQSMRDIDDKKYSWFAAEIRDTKELIGFIGLVDVPIETDFTPAMEIGWRIGKEYWKKGYATEGAKALLSFAFGYLKKDEIVSYTAEINQPSIAVMERIGMTKVQGAEFHHPKLDKESPLSKHVLYRLFKKDFKES
jgi:RimJ/RimL family protein N-acetyltransferase